MRLEKYLGNGGRPATSEAAEAVCMARFVTRSDPKNLSEDPTLFCPLITNRGHSRSGDVLGGRRGRQKGQGVDISEFPKRWECTMSLENYLGYGGRPASSEAAEAVCMARFLTRSEHGPIKKI